jgi:hypothetical protein
METKDTQVIYKRGETHIVTVLCQDDPSKTADLVIGPRTIPGDPVSEVLKEGGEVMSLDEASDLIDEQLEKKYSKIVEVDEEKYTRMLEVLPPEVWMTNTRFNHNGCEYLVSGFRMIEYMEAFYTDHYYKVSGEAGARYFGLCREAHPIVVPNYGEQWVMDERATTAMGQYVQEVLDCL